MEVVYKQPGTEVDDSYHNWRVPSKYERGLARGIIARGTCVCRYMMKLVSVYILE
jgi:hypothetical protein